MRTALSKIIDLVQVYTFKEGMTSILHFEKNIHKSMAYMSLRIVLFWDLLKLFFLFFSPNIYEIFALRIKKKIVYFSRKRE